MVREQPDLIKFFMDRQRHDREVASLPTIKDIDRKPPAPSTSAPHVINRMSERAVYDTSTLYANPMNPADENRQMVDRAKRAVELAEFPTVRDQDAVRDHLDHLLRRNDQNWTPSGLARRILFTGGPAYRAAFAKLVSAGLQGVEPSYVLTPAEQKLILRAMTVGTGSQGGFAVPYQLDPTVINTSTGSVNPLRQIARVEQTTGNEFRGVTSTGLTLSYSAEASEATDNSPTLVQPALTLNRVQGFMPVSFELDQDWDSLQANLGQFIQDAKDDLEATKFAVGTGTSEPQGVVVGATTVT
jgi:HK97 family phage major capsid protein